MSFVVLCAIVAIAAGLLHWSSHRSSRVGHWYGDKSWVGVYCSRGQIVIGIGREKIDSVIKHDYYKRPVRARSQDVEFDDSFHGGQFLGIGYYQSNSPKAGYVLTPIWLIWGVMAIPLIVVSCKCLKRTRRQSGNLCLNCGYDLRESSGRCPECGRELPGQAPHDQTHASSRAV